MLNRYNKKIILDYIDKNIIILSKKKNVKLE